MGPADENDRSGIKIVLNKVKKKYETVLKTWADMGYQGQDLKNHIKQEYKVDLEIVKRPPCRFWVHKDNIQEFLQNVEPRNEFKIQPKRWVVERTFAWINRNRRLSKEYDFLTNSSETFIYLTMSRLMLRRLSS